MYTTKQEIFNEVYHRLFKQGEPSIEGGMCLYRGPNNNRCAVGWLIPDEYYRGDFEGQNVKDIAEEELEEGHPLKTFLLENSGFLLELQKAHDDVTPEYDFEDDYEDSPTNDKPVPWIETWKEAMSRIAQEHNLTVPNVDKGKKS